MIDYNFLLSLLVYVSPRLGNLVLFVSISRRKECFKFVTYLCTFCFAIYSIQLKMRWFLQYLFAHVVLLYEPQYACFESDFASKPSKQNHVKSGIDIITTCIQKYKVEKVVLYEFLAVKRMSFLVDEQVLRGHAAL